MLTFSVTAITCINGVSAALGAVGAWSQVSLAAVSRRFHSVLPKCVIQERMRMRLYYFRDPAGNFGDDMNPWLWSRLAPGFLDEDPSDWFVGIGTLLNHRLPQTGRLHVMGSGAGYGRSMVVDERSRIHAVRGYHTAQSLGLPLDTAVADAAVLIRKVALPQAQLSRQRVGVMFTGQSLAAFDW
ncbi:MAG: hypothetical protein ACOVPA_09850, partial [Rubrivivax sp.]